MKYFILGNHLTPHNMSIEEAYASWRSRHHDIQEAFLNYDDVVAFAKSLKAQDEKHRPIIRIDVSKDAEEPLATRFYINGEMIKDKNRAVYLTMVSQLLQSRGERTEFTILDASFTYSDKYTPTISFKSSTIDFAKVRAELSRISQEEFEASIKSSQKHAKEKAATKEKADEQAKAKADEQIPNVKIAFETFEKAKPSEAAKAKTDEPIASAKSDGQVAKSVADEQAAKTVDELLLKLKNEREIAYEKERQAEIDKINREQALIAQQKAERKAKKNEIRIDTRYQEKENQKKTKSKILYGITVLTVGGVLLTLTPSLWVAFAAKATIMILTPIVALYAAKKGWDKFKDRNNTFKLQMEVNSLLYHQGYDLIGSKFGDELKKMRDDHAVYYPSHKRRDFLLWQKETINRVVAVNGAERKALKKELLEEGKRKFKF